MILIADDDPEILDLVRDLMEEIEWPHHCFTDGARLIEHARQRTQPVEVVLLDYQMPRLNGFDTLVELRRIPGLVHTPVLFFSADSSEERVIQGLDFGAEDFITKPFRIREFRSRLEKARKRYATEQNLRPEFGCLSGEGLANHWLGWPPVFFLGLRCSEWSLFSSKLPAELTPGQWLAQMLRIPAGDIWLVWLDKGAFGIVVPQDRALSRDEDPSGKEAQKNFLHSLMGQIRGATAALFSQAEQAQGYTYAQRPGGRSEMVSLDVWSWTACGVNDPADIAWSEMESFLLRQMQSNPPGHDPAWVEV